MCTVLLVLRLLYCRNKDEKCVGSFFMATPLLHLHDPEIIRHVFIKEFADFSGRAVFNDASVDPLISNLFNLSGTPWRNLRVKLSPTFTSGKLKYVSWRIGTRLKKMAHCKVAASLELFKN